jgi:MFS family permease
MSLLERIQELLDGSEWRKDHWKLFVIISLSFTLNGVLFSIVPATLYIISPDHAIYIMAINSIAFMLGSVFLGRLADLFGRRVLLITTLSIYLSGSILFLFSTGSLLLIYLSTSLINFGVGGEVGAAYSAIAEMIPARDRGKAIMLSANFWNIGAAIIAGLALIYAEIYTDLETQFRYLVLTAALLGLVVALVRIHIPESPRWLVEKNRVNEALDIVKRFVGIKDFIIKDFSEKKRPSHEIGLREVATRRTYLFRLLILVIITATQLLTYNMIAYYLPYSKDFIYGASEAPTIIFISNLGASIGAFILIPLIDWSRRFSTTLSYLGGFVTALSILTVYFVASQAYNIFLTTLFINMIFAEWAWASLSSLESELFPTGVRASVIGLNTGLAWFFNTLIILVEEMISSTTYLYLTTFLWLIGFIASLTWYIRGVETAKKPLEKII